MAQLDTIADIVNAYASDTEDVLEIAEINIHSNLANTRRAFLSESDEVDLYFTTVKFQSHIDTVITELNARETATINGGTF